MMDKISLKGLRIFANHGVFQGEKEVGQTFIVDCDCALDTRFAGKNDDLTQSLHYGLFAEKLTEFFKEKTFDLIEAAAEYTVDKLLHEYPLVRAITFTLKKPSAPVGLPLDYPALTIHRDWKQAVLALGSNMGNRQAHLEFAIQELDKHDDIRVLKRADFIETDPVGYTEQDRFINSAVLVETLLTPHELLRAVNTIEADDGRTREIHWGPRTLDIDIIYYDKVLMNDDDLIIPHPLSMQRAFVMEPVSSIAPYFIDPRYNQCVSVVWAHAKQALPAEDFNFTNASVTASKEEKPSTPVEKPLEKVAPSTPAAPKKATTNYPLDDIESILDDLSDEDFDTLF